ncbi:MAG: polysaccharide biosynthesis protein [Janthinobacterium lividum]
MFRSKGAWLSFAAYAFDLCGIGVAWLLAYTLRFNGWPPPAYATGALHALVWIVPIYAVMFRVFGLYRGMWVFASLPDLIRIAKAVSAGALVGMVAAVLVQPLPIVPRSVMVVSPCLLFMIMGGSRALYRSTKERLLHGNLIAQGKPVIVIGAGRAGATLARELARSAEWRLMGLLDDDPAKIGREIYGHRVLGSTSDLVRLTLQLKVHHVIVATPGASAEQQRNMMTQCIRAGLRVMLLPVLAECETGGVLSQIRHVAPEDMLGREPVEIDTEHVGELLAGKVVMVTGAGGSIGSELCRQILKFQPSRLIAFDVSEFAIYRLNEELNEYAGGTPIAQIVGDVRDALLVAATMQRYAPAVVFHAAAYKHVPLMEERNAWQAVRNNVLGTHTVACAAIAARVAHFVLISTDKAVNPTNVMGASKRLAEMVCQCLQQTTSMTQLETVRFGNVLGSAGSVIPKFQEQIAKGGPVTVTHPDITRYFMTIPEASQLVLQASCMGRGGEIFVLDMGKPMRIADLAKDMIRLYGLDEQKIRIEYTGLRPGEKLFEELLANDETTRPTHHAKLRIARARDVAPSFLVEIIDWLMQPRILDDDEVREGLVKWVAEYTPSSGASAGKNTRPSGADLVAKATVV